MEIEDVLEQFPSIYLQEEIPSFIKIFLIESPKTFKFLYQKSYQQVILSGDNLPSPVLNEEESFLDITGSPLNFTSYSVHVNDTVVKKSWSDQEEKYLSISLKNARIILSKYLTKVSNCDVPVWIACDGLDLSKTVLLSAFKTDGWCSRSIVQYKGLLPLSEGKKLCDVILTSKNVEVHCEFSFCESIDSETTLLNLTSDEFVAQNCTKMSLKLQWLFASIEVPQDGATAILAVNLNIGHKSSAINVLWSQYKIILKFCEFMFNAEAYKTMCASLPINYSHDKESHEEVSRNIISLINNFESSNSSSLIHIEKGSTNQKINENILSILIKQIICCTRPDFDVLDKIWLLLSEFKDAESIAVCLNSVFSKLGACKSKSHAKIRNNNTLLAKMIASSLKEDYIIEISVGKAVELMILCGIEKLKQDYIHVFTKLEIECTDLFKDSNLPMHGGLDNIKHNLKVLAQMHITLDLLCGVQFYFDFNAKDLKIFSLSVFRESCRVISSVDMLQNNPYVSMEVPLNFKSVVDRLPSNYSNLKVVSLKDKGKKDDYSMILMTSRSIFPPSLMQFDKENKMEEPDTTLLEHQYYVYELSTHCNYVGKQ